MDLTRLWPPIVPLAVVWLVAQGAAAGPKAYVSDADRYLWEVDTTTAQAAQVGRMPIFLSDLAISPDAVLYGISFTRLYTVDTATADVDLIGPLGVSGANALEFGPDGRLFLATQSGELRTVDVATGASSPLLEIPLSSGDLAFDRDGRLFVTTFSPSDPDDFADLLVEIDLDGATTRAAGGIGFPNVFGLAFRGDQLVGFTEAGQVIAIDTETGEGTLLAGTLPQVNASGAGLYRFHRRVLLVPGIYGSMGSDIFCNDAKTLEWLNGKIEGGVPDELTLDPFLFTYTDLQLELADHGFAVVPVPYDWRQSVRTITTEFLIPAINAALEGYPFPTIDIIAHSAGGLVVRDYLQHFYRGDVRRVVLLGTPQRGAIDAYLAWSGGVVESPLLDAALWYLATKINKACGCKGRKAFYQSCPAAPMHLLRDLLPTFEFLEAQGRVSNEPIPPDEMCLRNHFLEALNATADLVPDGVCGKIFAGSGAPTTSGFTVRPPKREMCASGKPWPDGKPVPRFLPRQRAGDGRVVLAESAYPNQAIPGITEFELEVVAAGHGDMPGALAPFARQFLERASCP
jgi:hypothetical protein